MLQALHSRGDKHSNRFRAVGRRYRGDVAAVCHAALVNSLNTRILQELQHIYQQVQKGNIISTASSNLLLLNVEDILGYAQLKAGKFTKNIKTFNTPS